jgi:hypothetical protein
MAERARLTSLVEDSLNLAWWARIITGRERNRIARAWDPNVSDVASHLVHSGVLTDKQARGIASLLGEGGPGPDEDEFGELAVERKFMSRADLAEAVEQQRMGSQKGKTPFLALVSVRGGLLTEQQAYGLLEYQERRGRGLLPRLKRKLGLRIYLRSALAGLLHDRKLQVLVACLLLAGFLVGRQLSLRETQPVMTRICLNADCGHRLNWRMSRTRPKCPRCGGDRLLSQLRCTKCRCHFALVLRFEEGKVGLDPCPRCASLEHVRVPKVVSDFCEGRSAEGGP